MSYRNITTTGAIALLISCPITLPSYAVWSYAPTVSLESGHSSNVFLTDEVDSAKINSVSGDLKIRNKTELSNVNIGLGASYNRFSGQVRNIDDTDSQYADISWRRRSESVAYGFVGSFRRDQLIRGEGANRALDRLEPGSPLPELDPQPEPENPDLERNVVTEPARRLHFAATPSAQFKLSPRDRLRVSVGATLRRFSGAAARDNGVSTLRDSSRIQLSGEWTRELSNRSVLLTSFNQSFLIAEDVPDAAYQQARVGWRIKPSERSTFGIALGLNHIDSKFNNEFGFLFNLNGQYLSQQGRTSFTLSRTVLPNAFGAASETDLVRIRHIRNLSQKLTALAEVRGVSRERSLEGPNNSRDHVTASTNLSWRALRGLDLSLGYEYRWIDRTRPSQTNVISPVPEELINSVNAEGHYVGLTLGYKIGNWGGA